VTGISFTSLFYSIRFGVNHKLKKSVFLPQLAVEICHQATPNSSSALAGGVRAVVVVVIDSSGADSSGPSTRLQQLTSCVGPSRGLSDPSGFWRGYGVEKQESQLQFCHFLTSES